MTSRLPMSTHRRMSFHFPFPSDLPRGMDILHKIYLRQHGFQMKGIVQAEQCVMYVRAYVIWLMHLIDYVLELRKNVSVGYCLSCVARHQWKPFLMVTGCLPSRLCFLWLVDLVLLVRKCTYVRTYVVTSSSSSSSSSTSFSTSSSAAPCSP